ncbi:hypothetical protein GTQ99_12880 [Kineococcus sp. T13]|uniref:hypothetical protein n=1 Tax=Kineococcus vitellinus TaxID=2696565 RepID=UPI001412C742|nr:hypothetical protein [Kineococcus vitellinus]NAZ76299.1 hypothetical protein [Kineococcus vitellinus]
MSGRAAAPLVAVDDAAELPMSVRDAGRVPWHTGGMSSTRADRRDALAASRRRAGRRRLGL